MPEQARVVFLIQNLRLKFYVGTSLEGSEAFLLHVVHNSQGNVTDKLQKAWYHSVNKRREISKLEKPADLLLKDIPAAMWVFVKEWSKLPSVCAAEKALNIK